MPAYIVSIVVIHDPEGFAEYGGRAPATVEQYGGRFLARGGETEVLEGEWEPNRLVILEFDSAEQARRWYSSEEYQAILGMRQRTATTDLVLVEGVNS